MRRIIYIPAWHVAAETGDSQVASAKLSGYDIKDIQKRGITYWEWVKELLEKEPLDPPKTRVYSEGAVLSEKEMRPILQKMADKGSFHMGITLDLLDKGAKYEPIEDFDLRDKQGRAMDAEEKTASKILPIWEQYQKEPSEELERRLLHYWNRRVKISSLDHQLVTAIDKGIAFCINQSLQEGETGILILGADHRVSPWLDQDIKFQPLKEELVELTDGDSGKNEINPQIEKETGSLGDSEAKG